MRHAIARSLSPIHRAFWLIGPLAGAIFLISLIGFAAARTDG